MKGEMILKINRRLFKSLRYSNRVTKPFNLLFVGLTIQTAVDKLHRGGSGDYGNKGTCKECLTRMPRAAAFRFAYTRRCSGDFSASRSRNLH